MSKDVGLGLLLREARTGLIDQELFISTYKRDWQFIFEQFMIIYSQKTGERLKEGEVYFFGKDFSPCSLLPPHLLLLPSLGQAERFNEIVRTMMNTEISTFDVHQNDLISVSKVLRDNNLLECSKIYLELSRHVNDLQYLGGISCSLTKQANKSFFSLRRKENENMIYNAANSYHPGICVK